jgi:hypothetical protein
VKRLPILTKVFLVVLCFSFMLSAYNAGSTLDDVLLVPKVDSAPTIDGVVDSAWIFPQVGMFAFTNNDPADSPNDLSAWFKLAWNDDGIYLFVHVLDDSIDTDHANSWRTDNIEIFIDGGNEDSTTYDTNDVQWRAVALEDTLALCWNAGTNLRPLDYTLAWSENADGYDMEIGIPDTAMVKQGVAPVQICQLVEGAVMGFDLQVADDDSVGSAEGLRWWTAEGTPHTDASILGTIELAGDQNARLLIRYISSAPTIDGTLDAVWTSDGIPEVAMSVIADGNFPDSGRPDFTTFFRAAVDVGNNFYLFGRVVDDSIDAIHPNDWQADCWEVYFDGDNSKLGSYDGWDDVQWRFVYGQDSATYGPGPSECDIAWVATDSTGYTMELCIPAVTLADTNITFMCYDIIGFEVQVSDNDGGDREGITKWWSPSNNSYLDPSLFGTAAIIAEPPPKAPDEPTNNIFLSVPAVLTPTADISYSIPARSSVKLSLVNLAGQVVEVLVNEAKSAGTYTASPKANLANGLYFCKLDACGETATDKVLVIK